MNSSINCVLIIESSQDFAQGSIWNSESDKIS